MTATGPSSQPDAEVIARAAKAAFEASQLVPSAERVRALHEIRVELEAGKADILQANQRDVDAARLEVEAGRMSSSLLSRLDLGKGDKWDTMLQGLYEIAELPDPTGKVSYTSKLDDGLELYRVSCPIGVLLVIFEARPEVVVNIAALAIKSGNAAILKGGKESSYTAAHLAASIKRALSRTKLVESYIQSVQSRADVSALLALDTLIDLVIPRGSNALVRDIQHGTRIPVMGHADGLCAVYLDSSADAHKAVRIVLDSKLSYPAACNAVETLIVHESLLTTVWPAVARALLEQSVFLQADAATLAVLASISPPLLNLSTHAVPSTPESYTTEHLSLTLSVLTVPSLAAAIAHVNRYGSHHTDCIVSEDTSAAATWVRAVDSAGAYVNASTRFADGFRYGFGAEVGIATGRIHARGPVGLDGLVTYKYVLRSTGDQGHTVGEFGTGEGKKPFKHAKIAADKLPF